MTIKTILLNDVRIDGNTQARVSINQDVVAHYADLMRDETLPPITVFFDGVSYWLADGFHRYLATVSLKASASIIADVLKGTQRDAVLFSLNANVPHGLSLTNDDKRKAVLIMLADPEWSELSNHKIARHCGCSHTQVGRMRTEQAEPESTVPTVATPRGAGTCSSPVTLTSPQTTTGTCSKPEPVSKTKKQQEDDQNAADAHGDSDPIAMLEEAQKQIEALQGELFALQADDQRAETLKFKRIADIATRRQNELMDTVNAREKELQKQANWLRRIGKALGEDDNAKLPALVEALKRGSK
ncbi:MAG: hypothetical protein PHD99_04705 [Candidatus Moranbacteria bacterium]|nr:hypothetical protein [Candidatus Moranbacteria bacterium]